MSDKTVPVLFRVCGGEVTAVFPTEPADRQGILMVCFSHVGQHAACGIGWYRETRAAKPIEYADLKHELESEPYEYRLKVYKRMQPWMRKTLADNARR